jgi:transcriptional regulator with XRE-family HTH domain
MLGANIPIKNICLRKVFLCNFVWQEKSHQNRCMKIGAAIKQVRLERGATQEQVALEAGTFAGNISKIERGQQLPSLDLLEKIAAALETRVSSLYARAEGEGQSDASGRPDRADPAYSNEVILLRRAFLELSRDNKQLTVEFVKLLNRAQRGELQ